MGLEVYYPTDIRNALLAAEHAAKVAANASNTKDDPFSAGFLTGYWAALTTLAIAFGLIRNDDNLLLQPTPTELRQTMGLAALPRGR